MDKVTVLIPVYNTRPEQLIESIRSMLNQTIECPIMLVDDGSDNEATAAAIDVLAVESHPRITCVRLDQNRGTSAAMNKGHELITTEYIAVMGSDDISDRHRLELQLNYLTKHPEIDVLGTQLFSFYDDDIRRTPAWTSSHPERPSTVVGDASTMFLVNHGTAMYKNQAVKDVGGYDLGYTRGQDARLWRNMAAAGKTFANLPQVLYAWRRFR